MPRRSSGSGSGRWRCVSLAAPLRCHGAHPSIRAMHKPILLATAAFTALFATPVSARGAAPAGTDYAARVARVLKDTPLIDGHNDWAETLAGRAGEKRWT